MSGSRSNPPVTSDRTSLDALSRTIEGLEARIEGLMGAAAPTPQPQARQPGAAVPPVAQRAPLSERRPVNERVAIASRQPVERDAYARSPRPMAEQPLRSDPLDEIRQRQRALDSSRERGYGRQEEFAPPQRQPTAPRAAEIRQPAPMRQVPDAMTEIAEALLALRHDLKKDIAEGVAREMGSLRAEIRTIKSDAGEQKFADGMREDLARLAESINQLADHGARGPEATALKAEFDDLRSLMDGLAREDSVRVMENRWDILEDRLQAMDTSSMQEELVALAYRIDDIKRQLGGMNDSPAVHALEEKLISIATAMEQLGNLIQPRDRAMADQFTAIDTRLDEISRAIVASGRTAASAADPALIQRLENRITALADQIDVMSTEAVARHEPTTDLAARIEGLTSRIDEMAHAEAAINLEARLNELSRLMENSQKPAAQPDLTRHLTDISRKIDALDQGAVNDVLAERLEHLARRIEQIDVHPPAPAMDEAVVYRLESRLADIAARLEESTAVPATDNYAMHALEDQMAHLSALLSEPRETGLPAAFDERMSAIEEYMSTNDEYVIEAARQAAEAVVQAYSRNGAMSGGAGEAEMSALAALAEDLRHLEDISRNSDERTHRTFEALHDTLVQIADRLDNIERQKPAAKMPVAEYSTAPFEYAEAPAARPAVTATAPSANSRSGPVIRTAPVSQSLVADEPVSDGYPIDEAVKAQIKADVIEETGRTSLFASLGKRFRPGRKAEATAAVDRQMIDPSPSIDPVDTIYTEETNELLEPGSGAPDIKKILEKVRASQNAARHGNGKPQTDSERADYIAAARRAAQAAALEVDQTPRSAAAQQMKIPGKKGAFARFRRPILLAVGAALLAIMAYPLVHTLTHGEKAPPAEISALTSAATPPVAAAPAGAPAIAPAAPIAAPAAPLANTASTAPALAPAAPISMTAPVDPLAPAVRPGSDPTSQPLMDPTAPAAATAPTIATPAAPAAAAPAAPQPVSSITVPDSIQPPALADAARKGDGLALFEIGARFTDGRGVPTDLKQAASWYQLSADKGFAPGQYRLASMYEKGNGIERDLAKAKLYYQQAADQGNASAMHNLAVLFASGAAGPQDYATAVDWFTKAANFGVSDSQFNLAILYARGNGVKQDLGESYKWFAIAAKAGDKDAAEKRDQVANALKPDQLQAAKSQVDLWKAQPLDSKANNADIPDEWSGKGVHTASIDMKKAIRNIQAILNNNGFDAGNPDGTMGDKTVSALKSFQKSVGLPQDGKITDQVVKELLARNKPA